MRCPREGLAKRMVFHYVLRTVDKDWKTIKDENMDISMHDLVNVESELDAKVALDCPLLLHDPSVHEPVFCKYEVQARQPAVARCLDQGGKEMLAAQLQCVLLCSIEGIADPR
jgi:hypothetical protein